MLTESTFIYSNLKSALDRLDAIASKVSVQTIGEKDGLSCFLFHAIKERGYNLPTLYPQENLTIALFENFIEKMLELNYIFIAPDQILQGTLSDGKKYGLITFDDGYFNNTWCLEILKKYNVPATFFITTSWITQNEKMWGDVIFHERSKQGILDRKIHQEIRWLVPQRISQIKDYITQEFGLSSFKPKGDQDRPLTESELLDFSTNPLVFIGNHTHNHECLSNLSDDEIKNELELCQSKLKSILGYETKIMAYPYGRYSDEVTRVLEDLNFKLGFTVVKRKIKLPIIKDIYLKLNRFQPIAHKDTFNFDILRSPYQFKREIIQSVRRTGQIFR